MSIKVLRIQNTLFEYLRMNQKQILSNGMSLGMKTVFCSLTKTPFFITLYCNTALYQSMWFIALESKIVKIECERCLYI
jgi:hypothetical protein